MNEILWKKKNHFISAVRLVQVRAELMQRASDANKGGMATVLIKNKKDSHLEAACSRAIDWCSDFGIEEPDCVVANYLFPQCRVISGNDEALRYIRSNMKNFNLAQIKAIPAYGAFHSKLMSSAVPQFGKCLHSMEIQEPIINVYSNVNALKYESVSHINKQLPNQIISPVKWEQTMHLFSNIEINGIPPETFCVGPGTMLQTILKQHNKRAWEKSIKIGD